MVNFADQLQIPQEIFDLHDLGKMNIDQIEVEVENFLKYKRMEGISKVLIITGKGLNSPKGPVLKPLVEKVLKRSKDVRTFHLASPERGGSGAFEVYLME